MLFAQISIGKSVVFSEIQTKRTNVLLRAERRNVVC